MPDSDPPARIQPLLGRPALAMGTAALLVVGLRLAPSPFEGPVIEAAPDLATVQLRTDFFERKLGTPEIPPDPDFLWALRPGHLIGLGVSTHINSQGMRGPEPVTPKPPRQRRVVLTGDSSVFGVKVRDDFALHTALRQRLGPGNQVYNSATPGWSTEQSLLRLRRSWEAVQPDLLVITNLWSDNNFDSFVDFELMAQAGTSRSRGGTSIGWDMAGQGPSSGKRRVPIDRYAANLDAMVTLARENGARVAFVIPANREDIRAPDRPWPWDPYRDVMRHTAARYGAVLVDIPEAFRRSKKPMDALFLDEMHPSRIGQALMARALADALRSSGWPELPEHPVAVEGPSVPTDPWVQRWSDGLGDRPPIAGILRGVAPGSTVKIEALSAERRVVDRVELPGSAPFALQPSADSVWLRATVRPKEGGAPSETSLEEHPIDLSAHPQWALIVDLEEERVWEQTP